MDKGPPFSLDIIFNGNHYHYWKKKKGPKVCPNPSAMANNNLRLLVLKTTPVVTRNPEDKEKLNRWAGGKILSPLWSKLHFIMGKLTPIKWFWRTEFPNLFVSTQPKVSPNLTNGVVISSLGAGVMCQVSGLFEKDPKYDASKIIAFVPFAPGKLALGGLLPIKVCRVISINPGCGRRSRFPETEIWRDPSGFHWTNRFPHVGFGA